METEITITIDVDYDQNLHETLTSDRFQWVNHVILMAAGGEYPRNEEKRVKFLSNKLGRARLEIEIFSLGDFITTDEVLAEFEKKKLTPINLLELATIDPATIPLEEPYQVAALRSCLPDLPNYSHEFHCPVLHRERGRSLIEFHEMKWGWEKGYFVAGIRKIIFQVMNSSPVSANNQ